MPREIPNIVSLIAGCCRNDRNSQRHLYQGLYGYAMKICFRYVHRQEEAEELVSESFIKLFKNIHQFDGSRVGDVEALLKGWFKRIVVNTCIDHLRRTQLKTISHEVSEEDGTFVDTQENGMDKIGYDEIIAAIRQLTPVYRTVFNLFVIEGFSHEEIATQLGISVGASKSNLSKARNNLRKIITKQTEYRLYA